MTDKIKKTRTRKTVQPKVAEPKKWVESLDAAVKTDATPEVKQEVAQSPIVREEPKPMINQPIARPKRTPIGQRNILTVAQRPGYTRRWVNDTDDRIDRFKEAGYEPVIGNIRGGDPMAGDPTSLGAAVTKSVGGGMKAVLMEIPDEYYAEDQAAKQRVVDKSEESLNAEARSKGLDNGEIKISRS